MSETALQIIERLRAERAFRLYPRASAYLLATRVVIYGVGMTRAAIGIPQEPLTVLPRTASDAEFGLAVLAAFAAFRPLVPDTMDIDADFQPVLRAAGVSSQRRLMQCSFYCPIVCGPDHMTITASHTEKGACIFTDKEFTLPLDASSVPIGATLLRAFAACTSSYARTAPHLKASAG